MKHLKKEMDAISDVCEVRAIYSTKVKASERKKITSSGDVIRILYPFYESLGMLEQKEIFACLFMDKSNKLLSIAKISEGTATACMVDIQYILRLALLQNAQNIIICHNHPSGNLSPSESDKTLTRQVMQASQLLNIGLLDHFILSGEGTNYYSFANEGLI